MKHYLRPLDHNPLDVRFWLQRAIKEWNLKATSWAKAAGISPSTLNRFLEGTDKTKNLNATTIHRLSEALELIIGLRKSQIYDEEFPTENRLFADRQITDALILGQATMTQWAEPEAYDPDDDSDNEGGQHWYIAVPVIRPYFQMFLAAFDVDQPDLEPVFSRGDMLVCAPFSRLEEAPSSGSYVIAHEIAANGTFRNSVMRYVVDPAGDQWLMPVGVSDASPIYVNRLNPGFPHIRATFLVVGRICNLPDLVKVQKSA